MSTEKREKTRELSEEDRHKIVVKHGQSQGYKSISRDLDAPVSTIHNVVMKIKTRGTVANLPGHGRKIKLDQRIVAKDCSNGGESTSINCQTDSS